MKCNLNVWIACRAALHISKYVGTNWYFILCLSKSCLSMDDTSLSRIFIFGSCSLSVNADIIYILISHISASLLVLVGITWVLLVS